MLLKLDRLRRIEEKSETSFSITNSSGVNLRNGKEVTLPGSDNILVCVGLYENDKILYTNSFGEYGFISKESLREIE